MIFPQDYDQWRFIIAKNKNKNKKVSKPSNSSKGRSNLSMHSMMVQVLSIFFSYKPDIVEEDESLIFSNAF